MFGEPPAEHLWGWPPVDMGIVGIVDADELDWFARRCTPMPVRTHTEPLPTPAKDPSVVPVTYVHAASADFFTETAQKAAAAGADIVTWPDAAHYPHVPHAQRVADVLLNLPR